MSPPPRPSPAQRSPQRALLACCVRTAYWLPVVFIVAIIAWSYYAYVVELCARNVDSASQRALYLVFFHVFLALFVWTYYQAVMTPPAEVPPEFYLRTEQADELERSGERDDVHKDILVQFVQERELHVVCRTHSGNIRYCAECRCIKPDRCHHCSVCRRCILKMDHHCPWVNNCVSFSNYKFFVMFLGYTLLYCLYVSLTALPYFIRFWTNGLEGAAKFHILFLFFVAAMFAISVCSLFGYHMFLVCRNRSTLESFRPTRFVAGPDADGFSVGAAANVREVFGSRGALWCLPLYTSLGDGVMYPTRVAMTTNYSSMNSTPTTEAAAVTTTTGGGTTRVDMAMVTTQP